MPESIVNLEERVAMASHYLTTVGRRYFEEYHQGQLSDETNADFQDIRYVITAPLTANAMARISNGLSTRLDIQSGKSFGIIARLIDYQVETHVSKPLGRVVDEVYNHPGSWQERFMRRMDIFFSMPTGWADDLSSRRAQTANERHQEIILSLFTHAEEDSTMTVADGLTMVMAEEVGKTFDEVEAFARLTHEDSELGVTR